MNSEDPKPNGNPNGRDPGGRFVKGNPGGPGNPNAAKNFKLRSAFLAKLKTSDLTKALKVIREVMQNGKDTDRLAAARELLDRVIGKAVAVDLLERLERLEALLGEKESTMREGNLQ